jgi:hypothetical protein
MIGASGFSSEEEDAFSEGKVNGFAAVGAAEGSIAAL